MTRRQRLASLGLSALLVPACTSTDKLPTEPYYTGSQGYVVVDRNQSNPYRKPSANVPPLAADAQPVAGQRFGPAAATDLPPQDSNSRTNSKLVVNTSAKREIVAPSKPGLRDQAVPLDVPLADSSKPLPFLNSTIGSRDLAGPKPPVIAPKWPEFGGGVQPADLKLPAPMPSLDPLPSGPTFSNPISKAMPPKNGVPLPESIVPPESAVSLKVPEPSSFQAVPSVGLSAQQESLIVRAIQSFQQNRPEEAVNHLKSLDPANQELLMSLMPLLLRLGEGSVSALSADETSVMIDRLQAASTMLKSRANLRTDRVCLCRGVRKFADVDQYEPQHLFHPGDMVFLYAELKNFTCEPVSAVKQVASTTPSKAYQIRLATTLELRDARNNLQWRVELNKTDQAHSPPQDYYHTYRLTLPEQLTPGTYTLWLNIVDKPTGRSVRKPIELRIGQS
ncbi:MAG: hypothetical protein K8T89_20440 [Planctomycetes bacterium]|nr:hypothetical protein [Planctomycetota bacterium]